MQNLLGHVGSFQRSHLCDVPCLEAYIGRQLKEAASKRQHLKTTFQTTLIPRLQQQRRTGTCPRSIRTSAPGFVTRQGECSIFSSFLRSRDGFRVVWSASLGFRAWM